MKNVWLVVCALVSFSAYAGPRVGDSATYVGADDNMNYQMTQTVKAFSAATGMYTMTVQIVMNGRDQTHDEQMAADSFPSDEMIDQILANCAMMGGVSERITVGAGTFDTCNVSGTYFGKVPFGIVKTTIEGTSSFMELVSFTRGQ